MNYTIEELKKGIKIHHINTNNFKTNLFAVFLATPLERKNVTLDALITAVLRRGTSNMPSQDIISKELEQMYGASFDCGIEKSGDNHIIKFYLEAVSEEFLPQKEELNKKCLEILFNIVFSPLVEGNGFKPEYVEGEKENLKQIIESKIDNKTKYASDRCVEEMYKGEPYGLYKYGYVEDLENITPQTLFERYIEIINNCKIDIFYSGSMQKQEMFELIKNNDKIQNLKQREPKYIVNNEKTEKRPVKEEKVVQEQMQVNQGKLVIGLNVNSVEENSRYTTSVYNAILGGGANSKLFQNVREKESLAYTAGSSYIRQKDSIFVKCGIEIENYEKALKTIKKQIEDIKAGAFEQKDIDNAKKLIVESVKSITSEQDTEITYYYGQELSNIFMSIDEYEEKIQEVSKEQITALASNINIDTIYFLRN